MNKLDKEKKH